MAHTPTARHQSINKALKRHIRRWRRDPRVRKVVLGTAKAFRHTRTPGTVIVQERHARGLRLLAYDERGAREIYLRLQRPGSHVPHAEE